MWRPINLVCDFEVDWLHKSQFTIAIIKGVDTSKQDIVVFFIFDQFSEICKICFSLGSCGLQCVNKGGKV